MADPIIEELALDIAPALESVSSIDDALGQLVANFGTGITDALSGVTSGLTIEQVDAQPVTDAIVTAVDDATSQPAEITADVTADTTNAADTIAQLAAEPVVVPVEADTTDAQDQIDQLSASSSSAAGSVDSLSGGVEALKGVSGLAAGEVEALGGFISNISPKSAEAVSGIVAVSGVTAVAVSRAADAAAQNQRFADTFGILADRVRQVDVGGLNIDLEDLAKRSGTANADIEATASRIGALGKSAGASGDQIVTTTQQILALGANASVTNPRLGDAAEVSDRLSAAFLRGGRALVPYGINLSKAQIEQEALNESGKASAAQLTIFERVTAGAALATRQFGDNLGNSFNKGATNAQVQLRAITTEVEDALVAIGTPILGPSVEVLHEFVPVAKEAATVIGALARVALPLLSSLGPVLVPVAGGLSLVADGLDVLASGIGAIPPPVLFGIAAGLIAVAAATGVLDGAIASLSAVIESNGPLLLVVGALAALGAVAHAFSDDGEAIAKEAKNIGDALFANAGSARVFKDGIDTAEAGLLKFFETQDQAGKLKTIDTVLDATGARLDQFATAVGGSDHVWQAFTDRIDQSRPKLSKQAQIVVDLAERHKSYSHALDALSQSEQGHVNQIIKENDALAKERVAFKQRSEQELQQLLRSGQLTQAEFDHAEAIAHSTDATGGSAAAQDFANQVLQLHAERERDATIATVDRTGALGRLRQELITGATTATDAETALVNLGLSADDAKTFVKGALDAVTQLQQSIIDKLPSTGDAIDQFHSDVKSAFGDVIHELGDTSGIDSATKAVDSANGRLAEVERRGAGTTTSSAASHAQAIREAKDAVSKAEQEVVAARNKDADNLAKAQQKLLDAADPGKFIAQLFTQANNARAFLFNLTKLSDEGFNALALNLAQKGPEAAGALADAFAKNEGRAKFAEAGIAAETTIEQKFTELIKSKLAPAVLGPSTEVGNVLGTGVNLGFAQGFDVGAQLTPTDADKQHALQAGSELGAAFAQGVHLGALSGDAIDKAAAAHIEQFLLALRGRADIGSPAKVFIPIGRAFAEGIAAGVIDSARTVDAATDALVSSVAHPLALIGTGPVDPRTAARTVANTPLPSPGSVGVGVPTSTVETKHVDVDVKLVKTDPDPRHFGAELARQIAT